MATLTNKNEKVVAPFYKNGVTLQFFQIDFGANVSGMLDSDPTGFPNAPRSPVAVALEAIAQVASIEVIGTVDGTGGTGQGLRIGIAAIGGAYGSDTYDGTNSETMAEHLEDLVKAAGTHQGVALSGATVVDFAL